MFKQENDAFPIDVQKYGCYFLSLLRICEIEAGGELTIHQVNDIYAEGRKLPDTIGTKCSCISPDKICGIAMGILGSKKKIFQVGDIDKNGKPAFWMWANKKPYNDPQYVCLIFATGGPVGTHYVLANPMHEILFDSSTHDYTKNKKLGGLLHRVIE